MISNSSKYFYTTQKESIISEFLLVLLLFDCFERHI